MSGKKKGKRSRNGHRNHVQPHSAASPGSRQPTELKVNVKDLVQEAFEKANELAKHEAGNDYGRICKPLLLGPQRYRDPDIWAPDYRLRGVAIGRENTPEQIAEMKKVPLTQDRLYIEASQILERLDAKLGLTASNE